MDSSFDVVVDDAIGHTNDTVAAPDLPPAVAAAFAADEDLVALDAKFADGGRWQVTRRPA